VVNEFHFPLLCEFALKLLMISRCKCCCWGFKRAIMTGNLCCHRFVIHYEYFICDAAATSIKTTHNNNNNNNNGCQKQICALFGYGNVRIPAIIWETGEDAKRIINARYNKDLWSINFKSTLLGIVTVF
jgi:hypothetical protein